DLKTCVETICRSAAVELVKNNAVEGDTEASERSGISVTKSNLADYLGRRQIHSERKLSTKAPGVVTGLAWTRAGGAILFIETKLTSRSEEHTSELQSRFEIVCRPLLETKNSSIASVCWSVPSAAGVWSRLIDC